MHNTGQPLRGLRLPSKSVVYLGKLTVLDMTPLGWLRHKTSTQNYMELLDCVFIGVYTVIRANKVTKDTDSVIAHHFFPKLWMSLCDYLFVCLTHARPASLAQLDEHQSGDEEIVGSNPAGSSTYFNGDWSWNISYGHYLPSADSRTAIVSSGKRMCTILVNPLEDSACPVKERLGKLTMFDMTPLGWLGHKTQHKH